MHMGKHPPIVQDWVEVAKWAQHACLLMPRHTQAPQLSAMAEAKVVSETGDLSFIAPVVEGATLHGAGAAAGTELLHDVIFDLKLAASS